MIMPLCFYSRCKPQGADVIDLVESTKRIFLGYPPYKPGRWDFARRDNVRETLYDLSIEDPTDLDLRDRKGTALRGYRHQVTFNQRLIRQAIAEPPALALVPRPELGKCFLGRVKCFELVDKPMWIDDYEKLRRKHESDLRRAGQDVWSDPRSHVGDVVQTFLLDDLRDCPFFAIPAWIRYQLFGRATAGRITGVVPSQDPYKVLSSIYETGNRQVDLSPTDDPDVVAERLLTFVTPAIFEHLVCELLQLDRAGEFWWHVGGTGDGGVDALGFNDTGATVGASQCKLSALPLDTLLKLGREMSSRFREGAKPHVYVWSLYTVFDTVKEENVTAYGRDAIVRILMSHRTRSVFAGMLGLNRAATQPPAHCEVENSS
jgi:hypothetical protein